VKLLCWLLRGHDYKLRWALMEIRCTRCGAKL
jgi:DNA-directed RNA polymerase subunit RPC12/RpoP